MAKLCYQRCFEISKDDYHALFCMARIDRKEGFPTPFYIERAIQEAKKQGASQEVLDLMYEEQVSIIESLSEKSKDFMLEFKCNGCHQIQTLKTGQIQVLCDRKGDQKEYLYHKEIMCKNCHSHNLSLTKMGVVGIMSKTIFKELEDSYNEESMVISGTKLYANSRKMGYSEVLSYFDGAIQKSPGNGELRLRYANSLKLLNKYEEAIVQYKEALRLNPELIACYLNLIFIFTDRFLEYEIAGAKEEAELLLAEMKKLYSTGKYTLETMREDTVSDHILDFENMLNLKN